MGNFILSQILPPHQKGIYKAKAIQYKIKSQGKASTDKKTTIGESLASLELEEKKEQEFHQNMLRYIESVVSLGILHNSKYSILNLMNFFLFEISINCLTLNIIVYYRLGEVEIHIHTYKLVLQKKYRYQQI